MTEWIEPKYPDDVVRMAILIRNNDSGDIRIQAMDDDIYRIGSFLPGRIVGNKLEPERATWTKSKQQADNFFDRYLAEAIAAGWSQP